MNRNYDIVTGKKDLELLYSFRNFPVFMGCSEDSQEKDNVHDMSICISKSSGCIQLSDIPAPELVYAKAHGSCSVGEAWKKRHQDFALFIDKYAPKSVFEIGGGSGTLAKLFLHKRKIPWTVFDPNPFIEDSKDIIIKKGFFSHNTNVPLDDTIVHSHTLEHFFDPKQTMQYFSNAMCAGQKMIFTLPNFNVNFINTDIFCGINFEHTIILSQEFIDFILKETGFKIIEKYEYDTLYVFYAIEKSQNSNKDICIASSYENNKKTFLNHIEYYKSFVEKLNKILDSLHEPVFLYGAYILSQYLVSYGLKTDKIINILDDDVQKHGLRLCGTNLIVSSPSILKKYNSPNVILHMGVHNEQISKNIFSINPRIKILNEKTMTHYGI